LPKPRNFKNIRRGEKNWKGTTGKVNDMGELPSHHKSDDPSAKERDNPKRTEERALQKKRLSTCLESYLSKGKRSPLATGVDEKTSLMEVGGGMLGRCLRERLTGRGGNAEFLYSDLHLDFLVILKKKGAKKHARSTRGRFCQEGKQ